MIPSLAFCLLYLFSFQEQKEPEELVLERPIFGILSEEDRLLAPPDVARAWPNTLGHSYLIRVLEAGTYTIKLTSPYFDARLVLRDENGKEIEGDNNGFLLTHSQIAGVLLAPEKTYQIDALSHERTGPYRLSLERGEPEPVSKRTKRNQSIEEAQRLVALVSKDLGPGHPTTIARLNELGKNLQQASKFEEARKVFERSLSAIEAGNKEELQDGHALTLNNLATNRLRMGRLQEALDYFEKSLQIWEDYYGPHHWRTALSLNNLGTLYKDLGRPQKAETLLLRAREALIQALGESHDLTGDCMENLAAVYLQMGDFEKARRLLSESLSLALLKNDNPEKPNERMLRRLNNLATVLSRLERNEEALEQWETTLELCRKNLPPEHPITALCLKNMAGVLARRNQHERAIALGKEALEMFRSTLGKKHPKVAMTLQVLGAIYNDTREFTTAKTHFEQALQIQKKTLGESHPQTAITLSILARTLHELGEREEAILLMEKALAVIESTFGDAHPETAQALDRLAHWKASEGQTKEAIQSSLGALRARRTWLQYQLTFLSERERLDLADRYRKGLGHLLALDPETDEEEVDATYSELLHWKGFISRGLFQDRSWLQNRADPATNHLLQDLRSVLADLSTTFFAQDPPDDTRRVSQLRKLRREREKLEEQLVEAREDQDTYTPISLDAVIARLAPEEAILDFFVYRSQKRNEDGEEQSHVTAFIIRANQPVLRVELGESSVLFGAIREHLADTTGRRGASRMKRRSKDQDVRSLLWIPLEPHLANATRIFVCPEGELATLPFGTIPGATEKTFLLEQVGFVYLQGALDLLGFSTTPPTGKGALLVGGLDFDSLEENTREYSSEVATLRSQNLRTFERNFFPIPGTKREILSLAHRFRKTKSEHGEPVTLTGTQATEERVKSLLPGKLYVHLATHGFFEPEGMRDVADPAASLLPGLLSGVVLSGANLDLSNLQEDSILTAAELAWLDLTGCDLITLSACETGLGTPRAGENLIGLRRSLRLAGARSAVTSLWKVGDQSTEDLMETFYRRLWASGEGKLTALRSAQLAMLSANRKRYKGEGHPETWGAFVLEGDWR